MPIKSQNFVLAKGYPAAAAITKKRAVKFVGDGTQSVTPCTAEGDMVIGVALFSVSATEITKGKKASVMTEGRVVMEGAAAISEGTAVGIDGSGRAIAVNTGARIIGICDEPCAGVGLDCSVALRIQPGAVAA
jgi:predicted RecA/RadA family phage recombinase